MADEIEEPDDDIDKKEEKSLRVSKIEVPTEISEPQKSFEPNVIFDETSDVKTKNQIVFQLSNENDEKLEKNIDEKWHNLTDQKSPTSNRVRQARSACRSRSRDTRQCQKRFQEMIGKHETRNDELEQREGDLRQRMKMLECSMPAVMSWNIWRMSQTAPASTVSRLLEKHFKDHGGDGIGVPSTPSQHYDCRVREIESERKEAFRRAEEARILLAEKEAAIEQRKKLLEDAKKCNQERREKIERLNRETEELRSAMKKAQGDENSCETGECGEIRCKDKWLENVGSVSSIGSTDLECFVRLQELAETEICMKQQISELERREEAYMRTLQQADELWMKMEGDTADTVNELQGKLNSKVSANQQLADRICSLEDELEKSKTRLICCKDALLKFTDKRFSDVEIGFDDGEATVTDRGVIAAVKTAAVSTSASPTIAHQETLAIPEVTDKEMSVFPETADANAITSVKTSDKDVEAIVNQVHQGVDRPTGLGIDANVGDDEVRIEKTEDLPSKIGSLRKLKRHDSKSTKGEDEEADEVLSDKWKDWDWDQGCPPDAICNDMVESSMVTDNLEHPKGVSTTESKVQATPEVVDQKVGGRDTQDLAAIETEVKFRLTDESNQATGIPTINKPTEVTEGTAINVLETNQIVLTREELHNWYNIVDSVHHMITKCVNCSTKTDDIAQLADRMKLHLQIKGLSGVKDLTMVDHSMEPEKGIIPVDETESSALGEVQKIVGDANQVSAEVEKLPFGVVPEPLVLAEEKTITHITTPEDPTHSTEGNNKIKSSLGEVQKLADDFNPIADEVQRLTSVAASGTSVSSTDRDGPADKVDPIHSVQTQATNDVAETLASSANGISSDVTVDFKLPVETLDIVPEVSGTKSSIDGQLDVVGQISKTPEQPTDVSKEQSAAETMLAATQQELFEEEPKEIAKFFEGDEKTFLVPETTTTAVPKDIVVETESEAPKHIDILIDETITDPLELSEELTKDVSAPTKLQVESKDSKEPSVELLPVSEEIEIKQPVVVPELTLGVEESKSVVDSKEDTPGEVTAVSFVTPRTPPSSRMDVQFPSKTDRILDETQQTSESIVESLIKLEELDKAEERPEPEVPSQQIIKAEETAQEGTEQLTPKIQGSSHDSRLDLIDEIPDKISSAEKIIESPKPSTLETPPMQIAKEEFIEKVKVPKALDRCICKPRTCPLLRPVTSPKSKLKAPKLFTEGTQTSPQVPRSLIGMLDKLKLKTITESSWPSPDVTIWRRPKVWSKRPRDKSTLTTPCVDTQTDSTLGREKIMLEGINRKASTTCSGFRPRYTDYSDCRERIFPQRSVPVDLPVAELFDESVRFPTSMASSLEKEIAVVKYDRSLMPQDGEFHCDECGRPITSGGTPLSEKLTTSMQSKSQRSRMVSPKKTASSTSCLTRKKDAFVCCNCKALDNYKTKESNKVPEKMTFERRFEKPFDKDTCCPCPADITKIIPTKTPKSGKKKRKPEKKDQSVMAVIPTNKLKRKESQNETFCASNMESKINSFSKIKTISKSKKDSKCICSDSAETTSITEQSSCCNEKIVKNESNDNSIIEKSLPIENISRDRFSIDSVSSQVGSCNCLPLTP